MKIETRFYPTNWTYEIPVDRFLSGADVYGRFMGSSDNQPCLPRSTDWCGDGKLVLPNKYCQMLADVNFCKVTIEFETNTEKRAAAKVEMSSALPNSRSTACNAKGRSCWKS